MKRLAENNLFDWFQNPSKMPLIIRGARQVGKSTLVRNFCKRNDIHLIEINLEKIKIPSFNSENIDLNEIISDIEAITRQEIDINKKQILFIDEIQSQPMALRALRYFFEEKPEIPIIAAGSLLDFLLNDLKIDFPVGRVSYLKLGPMSFKEFLMALDENLLLKKIKNPYELKEGVHTELLKLLRQYMYIGGMPKSVQIFIKTKKLSAVRKIQKDLLQSFKDDFIKYTKKERVHHLVNTVFDYVPFNLGKKIKYSDIASESRAKEVRHSIELLIYARILIPVYHTNASGLPISSQKDEKIFKLYFLDVGLVGAALDLSFENIDLKSMLEGPLAEQYIAQTINTYVCSDINEELFYWLRDKSTTKAEIDFILQHKSQIIPIEVKAGSIFKLKSLNQFCVEKESAKALVISLNQYKESEHEFKIFDGEKNRKYNGTLIEVPLYLTEFIKNYLDSKQEKKSP